MFYISNAPHMTKKDIGHKSFIVPHGGRKEPRHAHKTGHYVKASGKLQISYVETSTVPAVTGSDLVPCCLPIKQNRTSSL